MPEPIFAHPRLAAIYDALDPDRGDLNAYLDIAMELDARRVLDLGCGTGTFALLLANRGIAVIGVDPAQASLDVARGKPGAQRVRWIHGVASDVAPVAVGLVTMTANVAQAIVDDADWAATLEAARTALRPGGHLVFETRDPARRGWQEWQRDEAHRLTVIPGVGAVESRVTVIAVELPLVSFRWTYTFATDDAVLTSDSTVRFREREEVEADLDAHGFHDVEVRGAPDRPGRELVFLAQAGRRSPE